MNWNLAIIMLSILLAIPLSSQAEETSYRALQIYETDDFGRVLNQAHFQGWLLLFSNGTYQLSFQIADMGNYQYVKGWDQAGKDVIYFQSNKGYRFMAYPVGEMLEVWLYKTERGTNTWVHLQSSNQSDIEGSDSSSVPIVIPGKGSSPKVVMYGTTSAPSYYNYDPATGRFSHDQKGIIFRPDGTFYMKAEFSGIVTDEEGSYQIADKQIRLTFSDGSGLTLIIEQQGRKLHWYSSGMLIGEFFYLGEAG